MREQGIEAGPSDAQRARVGPIGVFIVFALLGPPLGGLIVVLALTVSSVFGSRGMTANELRYLPAFVAFVLAYSYVLGGVQAAAVGVVAAMAQRSSARGTVPLLPVLIASVVAGLASIGFFVIWGVKPEVSFLAVMLVISVGAGLLCRLICNRIVRKLAGPDAPAADPAAP
jgi:hypothetical protein